jgi:hypothetical protein
MSYHFKSIGGGEVFKGPKGTVNVWVGTTTKDTGEVSEGCVVKIESHDGSQKHNLLLTPESAGALACMIQNRLSAVLGISFAFLDQQLPEPPEPPNQAA